MTACLNCRHRQRYACLLESVLELEIIAFLNHGKNSHSCLRWSVLAGAFLSTHIVIDVSSIGLFYLYTYLFIFCLLMACISCYLSHRQLCCYRSSSHPPRSIQADTQSPLGSEPFHHSTQNKKFVIHIKWYRNLKSPTDFINASYYIPVGL